MWLKEASAVGVGESHSTGAQPLELLGSSLATTTGPSITRVAPSDAAERYSRTIAGVIETTEPEDAPCIVIVAII